MHFGEIDQGIPMDHVAAIRDAHPDVQIFTYPAGHGFNCDQRASYHGESAKLAETRTLGWLEKHLG
jgi:carboxymethylenebutenolidase